MRDAALVMLLPFFLWSWWIERGTVLRLAPDLPVPGVNRAVPVANLVSYFGMAVMVWFTYPAADLAMTRARISEAIVIGSTLREPIAVFHKEKKRFPADLKELGSEASANQRFHVELEKEGRIVIHVRSPGDSNLDGKRVELVPAVEEAGLRWACRSPDIEPRDLPAACR